MHHSFFNVLVPLKDKRLLLYNSLSLEIAVISIEEYAQIASGYYSDFHPRILDYLQSGFITPEPQEQYSSAADSDYIFKKKNPFIHLTIMMSESCNFSCNYCNQGQDKDKLILSGSVVDEICKYILNVSAYNSVVDVSWFGGEPLLSLEKLLKYNLKIQDTCSQVGAKLKSRVLTNGYLLTKKNALRLYNNNVRVVQVSFDGDQISHNASRYVKQGVDTYDIILGNLKTVLESLPSDFKLSLRVNVSKLNLNGLPGLVRDLDSRGFSEFKNLVVYWGHIYDPTTSKIEDALNIDDIILDHSTFGKAELELNRLLLEYGFRASHTINETRGNCIATQKNSFVIRPNGELHKCYIPVSNTDNSCGSIFDVNCAISSDTFKKWDSWSAFEQDNCSGCRLLGSCRGGCPINYISENYSHQTYKCPPSKLYFNEHVFDRAVRQGLLSMDDWDEELSPTRLDALRMAR